MTLQRAVEPPPRRCWNCKDAVAAANRIKLCPVCSRTYGLGGFVGGLIIGIVMHFLK